MRLILCRSKKGLRSSEAICGRGLICVFGTEFTSDEHTNEYLSNHCTGFNECRFRFGQEAEGGMIPDLRLCTRRATECLTVAFKSVELFVPLCLVYKYPQFRVYTARSDNAAYLHIWRSTSFTSGSITTLSICGTSLR